MLLIDCKVNGCQLILIGHILVEDNGLKNRYKLC